jgi:glutaminase
MAIVPGLMGIGVFSPLLNGYGNSVRGVKVCEEISHRLDLHVFNLKIDSAPFLQTLSSRNFEGFLKLGMTSNQSI